MMENTTVEIWKDIPGYEGCYQVSSFGRIKGIRRDVIKKNGKPYKIKERMLNPSKQGRGKYLYVSIGLNRKIRKNKTLHSLICTTFNGPRLKGKECNHIDGNKYNNRPENLEWITKEENLNHQRFNKLFRHGENVKWSVLKEKDVLEIRKNKVIYRGLLSELAKKYKVSCASIKDVFTGKTWKNV